MATKPWTVRGTKKGALAIVLQKRPKGKVVTVLSNVEGNAAGLLHDLKRKFGVGGAAHGASIELQGDHVEAVRRFLFEHQDKLKGVQVPKAGAAEGGGSRASASELKAQVAPPSKERKKPRHSSKKPADEVTPRAAIPSIPVRNSKPRCPHDWPYCSGWCYQPDDYGENFSGLANMPDTWWLLNAEDNADRDSIGVRASSRVASASASASTSASQIAVALKVLGLSAEPCSCKDTSLWRLRHSQKKEKIVQRQLERAEAAGSHHVGGGSASSRGAAAAASSSWAASHRPARPTTGPQKSAWAKPLSGARSSKRGGGAVPRPSSLPMGQGRAPKPPSMPRTSKPVTASSSHFAALEDANIDAYVPRHGASKGSSRTSFSSLRGPAASRQSRTFDDDGLSDASDDDRIDPDLRHYIRDSSGSLDPQDGWVTQKPRNGGRKGKGSTGHKPRKTLAAQHMGAGMASLGSAIGVSAGLTPLPAHKGGMSAPLQYDEEAELRAALEESRQAEARTDVLRRQEEEELERALRDSALQTATQPHDSPQVSSAWDDTDAVDSDPPWYEDDDEPEFDAESRRTAASGLHHDSSPAYNEELHVLMSMGFADEVRTREVLQDAMGDVSFAMEVLLAEQVDEALELVDDAAADGGGSDDDDARADVVPGVPTAVDLPRSWSNLVEENTVPQGFSNDTGMGIRAPRGSDGEQHSAPRSGLQTGASKARPALEGQRAGTVTSSSSSVSRHPDAGTHELEHRQPQDAAVMEASFQHWLGDTLASFGLDTEVFVPYVKSFLDDLGPTSPQEPDLFGQISQLAGFLADLLQDKQETQVHALASEIVLMYQGSL